MPQPALGNFETFYSHVRSQGPTTTKVSLIVELARGKTVLDLGCVGHTWRRAVEQPDWIHGRIREVATEVVGIDILDDSIQKLNEMGYRGIVTGDATCLDLGRTFDLVVAGDLIEHVANLEGLLQSVRRHLRPDGRFVLTTPNPFYINQFLDIVTANRVTVNDDHVCWFDPITTFQLLQRYGLGIDEFYWLRDSWGTERPRLAGNPLSLRRVAGVGVSTAMRPLRSLKRMRSYLSSDFAVVAVPSAQGAA